MNPVRKNSDGFEEKKDTSMFDPTHSNTQNPPASNPSPAAVEHDRDNDRSVFGFAVVAVGLALVIRFFIATPFIVSGSSMEHTFENNDYLIVDRVTYRFSEPQRGDVIVFGLPQETSRDLIKRIVGLPGDIVTLSGSKPDVTITNSARTKGVTLEEPYVADENAGGSSDMKITLGKDEYFVLGDNRKVSADSRVWGILPKKDIVGRVLLRLFPFNSLATLPGKIDYARQTI
jgi:signal peptidase I